jgi:hypothetical protein
VIFCGVCGTTKVVPFHKAIYETGSGTTPRFRIRVADEELRALLAHYRQIADTHLPNVAQVEFGFGMVSNINCPLFLAVIVYPDGLEFGSQPEIDKTASGEEISRSKHSVDWNLAACSGQVKVSRHVGIAQIRELLPKVGSLSRDGSKELPLSAGRHSNYGPTKNKPCLGREPGLNSLTIARNPASWR